MDVEAGLYHFCALQGDGDLYCWGRNLLGSTGAATLSGNKTSPFQITGTWSTLGAGYGLSCAVKTTDSKAYCWGTDVTGTVSSPLAIGTSTGWASLAPDYYGTCAVQSDGRRWCRGSDSVPLYSLGIASITNGESWVQTGAEGEVWTALDLDVGYGCGFQGDTLWCWGQNDYGQVGEGTTTDAQAPVKIW